VVTVRLDSEWVEMLRAEADTEEDRSVSWLVRKIVRNHLFPVAPIEEAPDENPDQGSA
jgi:Ribbon-helix-helix protein, copG family